MNNNKNNNELRTLLYRSAAGKAVHGGPLWILPWLTDANTRTLDPANTPARIRLSFFEHQTARRARGRLFSHRRHGGMRRMQGHHSRPAA